MKNYYSLYEKPFLPSKQIYLTKKQIFGLVLTFFCLFHSVHLYAIGPSPQMIKLIKNVANAKSMYDLLDGVGEIKSEEILLAYISSIPLVGIVLMAVSHIATQQLASVETISNLPLGDTAMFSTITTILTLFASLGCAYKIVTHYFKTEKFDNVSAFSGFFSYVPILVLFIFSTQIVNLLVSANQKINVSQISNISNTIIKNVQEDLKKDYEIFLEQQKPLEDAINNENTTTIDKAKSYVVKSLNEIKEPITANIKYAYYSIFSIVITSFMAIPVVVMTIMVKVLLTLGIIGAKIVFLLAFIPGFENTWRTYMLNLLNILLWIPIFNVIMAFIITIISTTISDDTFGTGQIIWLSILAVILTSQAVSLTTSTAQIIVNGSGAGMAGSLGSIASMSAVSMVAGAGSAAVGGISAGASVVTAMNSKAPTKKE